MPAPEIKSRGVARGDEPPQAAIRRGWQNGDDNDKNGNDKGGMRHLTTFGGRQNCSPPRTPIIKLK